MGISDSILTDRGTNFLAELVEQIYDLLDIRRLKTTPYHPQCDGLSERIIRTLLEMLRHYVGEDQDNWDQHLNKLAFAYNTSVHATTKRTPYELRFGRKARVPLDIFFDALSRNEQEAIEDKTEEHGRPHPHEINLELVADTYADKLKQQLGKVYQQVQRDANAVTQAMKIRYDRHVRAAEYEPGDQVLIRDTAVKPGVCKKLSRKFQGPYRVLGKINAVNYVVKGNGPKGRQIVTHVNRLKRWFGPVPTFESLYQQHNHEQPQASTSQDETRQRGRPRKVAKKASAVSTAACTTINTRSNAHPSKENAEVRRSERLKAKQKN